MIRAKNEPCMDQETCCACWPGVRRRAAKAEPALTPGCGGAQRSRLDLKYG